MPLHRRHIDDDTVGAVQRKGPHIDGVGQFYHKASPVGMFADARAHDDRCFGFCRSRRGGGSRRIGRRRCGVGRFLENFGYHVIDGLGLGAGFGLVLGSRNPYEEASHYG